MTYPWDNAPPASGEVDPIYCAYFTRKLPKALRARLHALTDAKRARGLNILMSDVVNQALEIGVALMEGRDDGPLE